jgi:hypothetical protein
LRDPKLDQFGPSPTVDLVTTIDPFAAGVGGSVGVFSMLPPEDENLELSEIQRVGQRCPFYRIFALY